MGDAARGKARSRNRTFMGDSRKHPALANVSMTMHGVGRKWRRFGRPQVVMLRVEKNQRSLWDTNRRLAGEFLEWCARSPMRSRLAMGAVIPES
jgi:hypothetical protein